jgi:three-Cys-motif partner protein
MTDLPKVGPWAKQKLDALARYLDFYTKVLKNQPWRTVYLDAYAGGGRAVVRADERTASAGPGLFDQEMPIDPDTQELIDGSPRVALGIANPFSRYVFVDSDPDRASELEALKKEIASTHTINILRTTAAEAIDWVTAQTISRRTHRGVAFLDPFGAQLNWTAIQKLANTGLFEVVINYAFNMAIQRLLPNSGEVSESWAATLDSYFGSRAWFEEVYQQRTGTLFTVTGFEKRSDYSVRLLELYRTQLRSAFGHVSTPRLIRNTRGAPLYYLLWAGPNKKGLEGANYILTMGERLSQRKREQAAK